MEILQLTPPEVRLKLRADLKYRMRKKMPRVQFEALIIAKSTVKWFEELQKPLPQEWRRQWDAMH